MTRIHRSILVAALLAFAAVVASPATAAQQEVFKAHLKGSEEVPARSSQATGQATFNLKATDPTLFEFKVTVGNIENVTAVQIQHGARGENGAVVATLYGPVAPGGGRANGMIASGALSATNLTGDMAGRSIADLVAEIKAGRIYVNVLTDDGSGTPNEKPGDFSSGEIRGQIN